MRRLVYYDEKLDREYYTEDLKCIQELDKVEIFKQLVSGSLIFAFGCLIVAIIFGMFGISIASIVLLCLTCLGFLLTILFGVFYYKKMTVLESAFKRTLEYTKQLKKYELDAHLKEKLVCMKNAEKIFAVYTILTKRNISKEEKLERLSEFLMSDEK